VVYYTSGLLIYEVEDVQELGVILICGIQTGEEEGECEFAI
jgi:hypothetical protein